ncbi:MAG: ABC transporter substrate-binding protein [Proteobacteria bacterium]|nr:ABC transporter substrate-binding protein [Pseudomonadota bacterium]MBU1388019.1 ABC transporter substrate-binding protein [Pseudomonadota bacterium]MBU1542082.1 ABC transporter substrate-binding protein [Pseudomonadota bacterium]MBU2430449.1 ABC transporter substrate-binding protein [Pseudomonadota bacterium]MBU2482866.1 ABC transporter substrate-binding protein [Pseudomonadota bacterium]
MKKLKHLSFILIAGLLALGLFSPNVYAKGHTVMIGFTGPLSGPAAQYGRDNVNGLEMGIQDINAAGGITVGGKNYKFALKTYDDHIDPTAAVNNARRLRSRDGARFIFNPVFNTIAPMMQINQQKGSEFLMMAYTSAPEVDAMKNPNTIAIPPPFSVYVGSYVKYALEKGWKKCAMVVTLGAYGDGWRKEFESAWIKAGGEIVADQPANYYTETDFSAQLSAALAKKPDFMLIGGPSATTGLVIEQARNLGFKGEFFMVDQAKLNYIAEVNFNNDLTKMNGVTGTARPRDLAEEEVIEPFLKRCLKDYGRSATSENLLNYGAIRILAAAMEKAGTVEDITAIKAAIPEVLPMDAKINLLPFIDLWGSRFILPGTIQKIENGQYTVPTTTFWWTKSDADFKKAVSSIPDIGNTNVNVPLEGYAK